MTKSIPEAPEIIKVGTKKVVCDGDGGALGHPRVYLNMGEKNYVECGYCDRRYEFDETLARKMPSAAH